MSQSTSSTRAETGKQRILQAAETLFGQRGFLGVSAAEIAKEAGVAHGLLFHHFGSMEDLYAEVTRLAAQRMDAAQMRSFRGTTAREQITAFLLAHMRAMRQREGDAIFRARSLDASINKGAIDQIWEASRYRAIDKLLDVLGITNPTKKMRICLRAWIGFHDQLVVGWLTERALTQTEVLEWTLGQLERLASEILQVDLDRVVLPTFEECD